MLNNSYDVIPFFPLFILHMSTFNFKVVIYELPPFVPNQTLFSQCQANGKERWQVFADSVREVMSKATSIDLTSHHFREKEEYQVHLGYKKAVASKKRD
jgi:hypothetical protein